MKKEKKFTTIVLCVLLVVALCLSACKKADDVPKDDKKTQEQVEKIRIATARMRRGRSRTNPGKKLRMRRNRTSRHHPLVVSFLSLAHGSWTRMARPCS